MKNEPCVRFGIFINPKIKEKPADSRKRRPPSVRLLTASTSVRLMSTGVSPPRAVRPASALQRRVIARIDRLGQKPLLVIGPELAHVPIGLDRRVDQLVALPVAPPDVEIADDVAEAVEVKRPARGIGERHAAQGPDQRLLVLGLPARLLERGLRDHAVDVETGGIEARDVPIVAHHPLDAAPVARRVEVARIEGTRDHADRLVAEALQQGIVAAGTAADEREPEAMVLVLL